MENILNNPLSLTILNNLYDGVYFIDRMKKIRYWNRSAEIITGFPAKEMIGLSCLEDILTYSGDEVVNLCKGECPLCQTMDDGQMRETEVYLQHKDGHKVPVLLRAVPVYDANGDISGIVEIFSDKSLTKACLAHIEELERESLLDQLTGVANRKYAEMSLEGRLSELARYDWPFGVVLMDIDRFRMLDQMYGNEIGDKVLKMVAKTLVNSSRSFDVIGRWSDDEFIGIIINVNENKLYTVAHRFLTLVEQSNLSVGPKVVRATLSAGATLARIGDTAEDLIGRAEILLAKSREIGGNRIAFDNGR
jgi:diguanylate cyclase (GGDEF)-like protein/PAS domain S-box-containing protein